MSPTSHPVSFSVLMIFVATTLLLCVLLLAAQATGDGENSAPTIENFEVTPRDRSSRSEYLFTATYRDENNDAPRYMQVVIDNKSHNMRAVDTEDENYADGKDYYYRTHFKSNKAIYFYFKAGDMEFNVTSRVKTLYVEEIFEWHFDIALVFGLYLIPTVWVVRIAHKMSGSLKNIEKAISNEERKEEPVGQPTEQLGRRTDPVGQTTEQLGQRTEPVNKGISTDENNP